MGETCCYWCRATSPVLFVVEGRIGTYYECHRCRFGVDAPAASPELITDTFAPAATVARDFSNADEARLLALVDKLTGARA